LQGFYGGNGRALPGNSSIILKGCHHQQDEGKGKHDKQESELHYFLLLLPDNSYFLTPEIM
jgi:hypothetical protein